MEMHTRMTGGRDGRRQRMLRTNLQALARRLAPRSQDQLPQQLLHVLRNQLRASRTPNNS
jgi:hypothetical protein